MTPAAASATARPPRSPNLAASATPSAPPASAPIGSVPMPSARDAAVTRACSAGAIVRWRNVTAFTCQSGFAQPRTNRPNARNAIGAPTIASGSTRPARPSMVVERNSERPVPRRAVARDAIAAPATFPTAPSVKAMPTAAGDRPSARYANTKSSDCVIASPKFETLAATAVARIARCAASVRTPSQSSVWNRLVVPRGARS
jgi:hypothetical protein